ncbi:FAD-binding oxidoreductase [Roseococcus sp. SYP-B2431]|uniref:NAD(P)/FAD-dependent oxidoreductase n=1 Tax=Roseococcus sp. SYP-B2431 TaxID=2496640 RepID=UPI00103EBA84|nr:FAD-binding oxidoreductase [Roseococcus sp. SYP-B2431]TCH96114.1 FAD-binding oxidoreductase [Roseococcus sp. SYP-B2431]
MDTRFFDALVIGAGIAGATAGAHLSPTHKVALLEAEESAGYHTTGRSAAIWILSYGSEDAQILTGASRRFLENPPPGFTEVPIAHPRAVLNLAKAEDLGDLQDALLHGRTTLTLAQAQALVPALKIGSVAGAAIEYDAFDIDIAALHQGFLKQIRANGGVLALRNRVGRIWREKGAWHAEGAGGEVYAAPVIVNAAGAWGDVVATIAGVTAIGLQPKRRTALIIDPGEYDTADWPMVVDVNHSWYVRPEARRKLMVSPADETDSAPMDAQPDELDVAIAIDRMQQCLDIPVTRVEHRWAGLRTFTPDRGLAIGASEQAGFFWFCGQGGYGIQTAPAAGRLLAQLIRGETPDADVLPAIAPTDPTRFHT